MFTLFFSHPGVNQRIIHSFATSQVLYQTLQPSHITDFKLTFPSCSSTETTSLEILVKYQHDCCQHSGSDRSLRFEKVDPTSSKFSFLGSQYIHGFLFQFYQNSCCHCRDGTGTSSLPQQNLQGFMGLQGSAQQPQKQSSASIKPQSKTRNKGFVLQEIPNPFMQKQSKRTLECSRKRDVSPLL